jgi:hypothetical protein
MDPNIITDDQVEAFERDGVVTVDTPWSEHYDVALVGRDR